MKKILSLAWIKVFLYACKIHREELYSTTSRPFPKPKTGRIAVKVINHYGDEVMKIVDVK